MDEKFKSDFYTFRNQVQQYTDRFHDMTEEATKNAIIMPFFVMLGYNVFDLNEFIPEYTCDVGTKKGEKIDYAIALDGDVSMLVEAKRAGIKLQKQQQSQLYRYFGVSRCRIAILTNGVTYQFFSDINAPNVMDEEPFFSFHILEDDPEIFLSALARFRRSEYNEKEIINKAIFQKYEKVVQKMLRQDMVSPSNEIVRYFLSSPEINVGSKITSKMVEKYREATANALKKYFARGLTPAETHESCIASVVKENCPSTETKVTEPLESPLKAETVVVESEVPVEETVVPSPQELMQSIQSVVSELLPESECKEENGEYFSRLHIYASDNRKIGVVKVSWDDYHIQFRNMANGMAQVYEMTNVSELRKYIAI